MFSVSGLLLLYSSVLNNANAVHVASTEMDCLATRATQWRNPSAVVQDHCRRRMRALSGSSSSGFVKLPSEASSR